ncbi:glycine--tRNA ligase [Candidatus Peregrinibacteria bacterium]|nr:glycine--tRNA ligase [Candidatus Peregrinibacteria bacterium]MBT7483524.1 glycine--tRNA ligase [Candidatus Peregrinibacteria bacterium]MBT7702960.1 glycine--tRNA ligase [Candidatus Peregrinibacteria bacterium]
MQKIVSLCKRRGFVFPGSDIYGGLANTWDYGPLGVELKKNVADAWWKFFVSSRLDMLGLDAAILMNPKVWQASGHVENFNDAQVDCKECKARHRADHLIEDVLPDEKVEGLSPEELTKIIEKNEIKCPKCGKRDFTKARVFNLLFQTSIGSVEDETSAVYLRGELAQGMFVNFKAIQESMRKKLPFGIAQMGRCFRNEITPGNFIFRTLEFDLMEFEYFIHQNEWENQFEYWLDEMHNWVSFIGLDKEKTRVREHTKDELSHYSKRTVDIEYETPFGWKEMYGLAYRTDFDLKNHMEKSGQNMEYLDPYTNEKFIPHVVEPTFGLSRTVLMILLSAYDEEAVPTSKEGETETRVVMRFAKHLAPFKVAILPLSNKLLDDAKEVWELLSPHATCDFDTTGSIGKRYRRQDEIGTPYCVTYDFDSGEDGMVTIRDRDTMEQERVKITDLVAYLSEKLAS